MYEKFYGLNEKPFSLAPDPAFLYMAKGHTMAYSMLEYSLTNESAGICVISGEIGSGKTTLIRKLLSSMDQEFTTGLITNTHSDFGNLLQWVSMAFSLDYKNKEPIELYENFVNFAIDQYARGNRTVLIIDEVQNLSYEALEELRMLSNINADKHQVLYLILVGQPELREKFNVEKMKQFNQRITVSYHLKELNQQDSAIYIKHRLKTAGGDPEIFTDAACRAVWSYSKGIPRIINTLCDTALVYAFAEQKNKVDIQAISEVIADRNASGFHTNADTPAKNTGILDDDPKKVRNIKD